MKAMPELQLRPSLTMRATKDDDDDETLDSGTSVAASLTTMVRRFHGKPSRRRKGRVAAQTADTSRTQRPCRRRCRWLNSTTNCLS
ncbi:hypothetical protein GUJ93_ZPchr0011g28843 [Zizania palustris]|uniref:Uncharacterized protein n=1 Tax=Zizania palustris TaxID=103762 RepID=A0A8J5WIH6_ZIZPA|nr:hypothetical protein GUJ93_ZPchr0011g28843 [Zizania palustris]